MCSARHTHASGQYPTVRVPWLLSCPALFDGAHRVDDRVVGVGVTIGKSGVIFSLTQEKRLIPV